MNYEEMKSVMEEAKDTIARADALIVDRIPLFVSRLKSIGRNEYSYGQYYNCLIKIKSELKSFNSKTRRWK
mgnify:CR=1 FL=1